MPSGWRPIALASRDGLTIVARRNPEDAGQRGRRTWWGQDSHGNTGWCLAIGPQDVELWQPDEWHHFGDTVSRHSPADLTPLRPPGRPRRQDNVQ